MLEFFCQLDTQLFIFFNVKLSNGFFDLLMPLVTDKRNWFIPIVLSVLYLIIWGKKKGRVVVLLLILGITLSDQTSSHLIKPLVGRARPCNVLENINVLIGCSHAFSFPSSHATNVFCLLGILSYNYLKTLFPMLFIAILVSFSRIYVGVHYPFDALAGAVLGILCATIILSLFKILSHKLSFLTDRNKIGD